MQICKYKRNLKVSINERRSHQHHEDVLKNNNLKFSQEKWKFPIYNHIYFLKYDFEIIKNPSSHTKPIRSRLGRSLFYMLCLRLKMSENFVNFDEIMERNIQIDFLEDKWL